MTRPRAAILSLLFALPLGCFAWGWFDRCGRPSASPPTRAAHCEAGAVEYPAPALDSTPAFAAPDARVCAAAPVEIIEDPVSSRPKAGMHSPKDGQTQGMEGSSIEAATAGGRTSAQPRVAALLRAIRQVESAGDDKAIGDGGKARGPLQIHRALWTETCRRMRWDWKWPQDAHDWSKSSAVTVSYWRHYGMVTDEERARSWNGGPTGPSKKATLEYWQRVKGELR